MIWSLAVKEARSLRRHCTSISSKPSRSVLSAGKWEGLSTPERYRLWSCSCASVKKFKFLFVVSVSLQKRPSFISWMLLLDSLRLTSRTTSSCQKQCSLWSSFGLTNSALQPTYQPIPSFSISSPQNGPISRSTFSILETDDTIRLASLSERTRSFGCWCISWWKTMIIPTINDEPPFPRKRFSLVLLYLTISYVETNPLAASKWFLGTRLQLLAYRKRKSPRNSSPRISNRFHDEIYFHWKGISLPASLNIRLFERMTQSTS